MPKRRSANDDAQDVGIESINSYTNEKINYDKNFYKATNLISEIDLTKAKKIFNVKNVSTVEGYDDITPLHIAAKYGKNDIIKYFVNDLKADINAKTKNLWTPLMWAVFHNQQETVELLLNKKASIEINHQEINSYRLIGVKEKKKDFKKGEKKFEITQKYFEDDHYGPLNLAIFNGNIEIFKTLLDKYVFLSSNEEIKFNEKSLKNAKNLLGKEILYSKEDGKYMLSLIDLAKDLDKKDFLDLLENKFTPNAYDELLLSDNFSQNFDKIFNVLSQVSYYCKGNNSPLMLSKLKTEAKNLDQEMINKLLKTSYSQTNPKESLILSVFTKNFELTSELLTNNTELSYNDLSLLSKFSEPFEKAHSLVLNISNYCCGKDVNNSLNKILKSNEKIEVEIINKLLKSNFYDLKPMETLALAIFINNEEITQKLIPKLDLSIPEDHDFAAKLIQFSDIIDRSKAYDLLMEKYLKEYMNCSTEFSSNEVSIEKSNEKEMEKDKTLSKAIFYESDSHYNDYAWVYSPSCSIPLAKDILGYSCDIMTKG